MDERSTPTLAEFADATMRWLRDHGETDVELRLDKREILVRNGDTSRMVHLSNAYFEYSQAKVADRPHVLENFMRGMSEAQGFLGLTPAEVKPLLRPIVRDLYAADQYLAAVADSIGTEEKRAQSTPAMRNLLPDCMVGLAIDQPHSMALVSEHQLSQWGITFEQALEQALGNLRQASKVDAWKQVAPSVWGASWRDGYDSSRILLPECIERLGLKDAVAMVPFRDTLLVTSSHNAQAVALLAKLVQEQMKKESRWVSFKLLRRRADAWEQASVPAPASTVLRELDLIHLAKEYGAQGAMLQERLDRQGEGVFVAGVKLARKGGGLLTSISVWPSGTSVLLPQTDVVVLSTTAAQEMTVAMLPWSEVMEKFGHLLEPTDHRPVRFRTKGFPPPQALAGISKTLRV